ncbi:hypothetical protein E4T56_gene12244 [Termitomyces sp. T112]|nr:hypothetical protein E4T56_gene12244 [Termitomyces sp. T112]KAH0583916.1 hypothetical protein H2248_009507 [Termitomyces sp. 'cryptogamus']
MSRLTSAQVIALGEYLEPTFDPASLTVSQLLGVLGYHNVKYPTPYSKSKLAMIFNEEIKAKSVQLKKERVKKENSIASDDGILDGTTGQPLRKESVKRRTSRRLSHAPAEDEVEVHLPYQPKRRRSSAQPTLGGPSRKNMSIQFTQPTLVEESEAEDLPIKKVARNRKKVESAGAHSRCVSNSAAEDSGWEDNNIFQSGAESSSPVRPSPIRPKTTRKSVPGSQKSRKSSSAPPQMPFSSPSGVPDFSDPERMSPLPPPQFKFEPNLSNSPMAQLHSKQSQSANFTPFQRRVPVFDTKREDDRDGFDVMSDNFSVANQVEPTNENTLAVLEEQDEVEGSSFTDLGAVEDCINAEFESVTEGGKHLDKRQGIAYGRIVFYGSMCLLTVIAFSAVISHKMDSASIGYCDAGSSTNSNLEQRRAERAAAEVCNREADIFSYPDNNTAVELNTTSCPIPSLVPWRPPDSCTPCPHHANCTPTSVLCNHGYALRSHPLLFFVPASPSPRNTTISISSPPVDLFWKVLSVLDGLPGLGSVAFPPRCIEDPERKKKIGSLGKAIESFLGQERGRRLCAGGETLKEPIDDSDGGDVKKWGMELENLREIMQKKTHPHLLLSFDDMFDEAIQQLTQWGGVMIGKDHTNLRYVAHKTPSLTWDCVITVKFRKFWVEWRPIIIGFMFVVLSFVYWRARNAQKRVENQRVADLVQIALDTLRNQEFAHHTDPVTTPQPYLSSLQLRDLILQDEHSVTSRSRLWDQVERVVEGNANVRANLQEIQGGDEMRVWRWIGSARRKTNPSR